MLQFAAFSLADCDTFAALPLTLSNAGQASKIPFPKQQYFLFPSEAEHYCGSVGEALTFAAVLLTMEEVLAYV